MVPVENLHLDHVQQIVCVLESVILRCFGPDGGQVLFIRDTGQAMISCSGSRILSALRLEHPLARMVVDCVLKHSTATGDGSKTFVLLLTSLLRTIHASACKEPNVSHNYVSRYSAEAATGRHLAFKTLEFASEQLENLITAAVIPYGCSLLWEYTAPTAHLQTGAGSRHVQKLLASFFCSRLSRSQCDFATSLTCNLLSSCGFKGAQPSSLLQFLTDNFPTLHTRVSGFPFTCSRLVEGQVIHRDFASFCPPNVSDLPVKAVIFTGGLEPEILTSGEVLELACGQTSIVDFKAWAERSLSCVFANLQRLGISLLLSAVKQSPAVLSLAAQANICIVECVSEDELTLFAQLSRTQPVSDCQIIGPSNVATLTFCRPIHLGPHRYVHLAFQDSEERVMVKLWNLVICGPGEGQTDQYASAILDAILMLLSAWQPLANTSAKATEKTLNDEASTCFPTHPLAVSEPGCVIPAGGTFEFLLTRALLQQRHKNSGDSDIGTSVVSQLLADALLTVPRQIYSCSQRHFLHTQDQILNFIKSHSHPFSLLSMDDLDCCGKASASLKVIEELGLESVSCKYQLLLAVVQCASRLLQVDTVLQTHAVLNTRSHRLTSISSEGEAQ
ncbi:BBSome complex assembly protein BBS10 isoform X1 [Takifugu rubripes]|uniref:BBSome complex assembly protein BBS10 isoform X1 n=1 Tax=Takifugu rubripes TaxID=31033 RepID=UPI0011455C28|nr:Bardet-Biedl syndrome 10 protein isoform X1 [Takifugu rubripes]